MSRSGQRNPGGMACLKAVERPFREPNARVAVQAAGP